MRRFYLILVILFCCSCNQLDTTSFVLEKNHNGEPYFAYDSPGDTIGPYNGSDSLDLDYSLYFNGDAILNSSTNGISGGSTGQIVLFSIAGPQLYIATDNFVDTVVSYTTYPSVSDSAFWTVSYSDTANYPATHSQWVQSSVFAVPFLKGATLNLNELNFTNYLNTFFCAWDHTISYYLNYTTYTNIVFGPWVGKGRRCVVYKFLGDHAKYYYGWAEIEVISYNTLILYGYYSFTK